MTAEHEAIKWYYVFDCSSAYKIQKSHKMIDSFVRPHSMTFVQIFLNCRRISLYCCNEIGLDFMYFECKRMDQNVIACEIRDLESQMFCAFNHQISNQIRQLPSANMRHFMRVVRYDPFNGPFENEKVFFVRESDDSQHRPTARMHA